MYRKTLFYALVVILVCTLRPESFKVIDLLRFLTLCFVIAVFFLIFALAIAAYRKQDLILLHPTSSESFIGKPLLFPAKLSHARLRPMTEKYNYWYDYFLVGIPVGLRGRIGNLVSIDNEPTNERPWEKCWFTIDPAYYLDRGSGSRSLLEKLHIFLQSLVYINPSPWQNNRLN